MRKRDAFLAAVRTEIRLVRAESAPKLVILLTIGALIYALIGGSAFSGRREQSAAALKVSAAEKFTSQREQAQQIAEGKKEIPDRPYRDAGNTIFAGRMLAEIAELPQSPLSFLAVAESDLYPAAIPVSAKGKEGFLFDDEISNPTHLLTGIFDPAFVLVVLLPLFILALCYNIISGEREQGTLSLIASSPVPMRVIMSAKLLVRVGVPVITAVVVLIGAVFILKPEEIGPAAVLASALVAYGLFWGAAALAINGFGLDSTGNALVMSVLWISLAFVIPAMIDASVELVHPAPARSAMVLAVRNSTVQADAKLDAAQALFALEHAGAGHTHDDDSTAHEHSDPSLIRGSLQEKNYRTLQGTKAAQAVGDSIYQVQQDILFKRKALADTMRFLSPVMIMQDILAEISGNGSVRYRSFLNQVDQFHDQWRAFFVTRAEQRMRLDGAEYDKFPKFRYEESTSGESASRIAVGILAITLFLMGSAAAAKMLLNRFRIAGR